MTLELDNPERRRFVRGSNGHLWYQAGRRCTPVRLTSWKAGLSLERCAASAPRWIAGVRAPAFQLVPSAQVADDDPLRDFIAEIPAEAREVAAPITWQQLPFLQLCRRDARAVELAQTNRPLAWLL